MEASPSKPARRAWPIQVFVATATVALLALAALDRIEGKDLVTALMGVVGTASGALLAFRLNESREDAKEVRRRKAALTYALFVLIEQEAAIRDLWDKFFLPWAHREDRAFNLPSLRPPDYSSLKQDVGALQFLFEEGMDASAGNTALKVLHE